ncbi:hypothetical protein ACHRV5_20645 [Flavobacterium sp. FlaQc-52]|jgi:hypothetical protein|uniref:hypothetical protein n=1 Tax=Flavobacterium sp. FlaQc-52 TaxID=3374185 RepID=UPI0037565D55
MKVLNIHKREINQPIEELAKLLSTLSTENDMLFANEKWFSMKLDKGLQVGSKGGHGPIRYFVTEYLPGQSVTFQFDMTGFDGFHRFDLKPITMDKTELSHTIDMRTTGKTSLRWAIVIRWLHDAVVEDSFDKVENHFTKNKVNTPWSLWVRILRKTMSRKQKQRTT